MWEWKIKSRPIWIPIWRILLDFPLYSKFWYINHRSSSKIKEIPRRVDWKIKFQLQNSQRKNIKLIGNALKTYRNQRLLNSRTQQVNYAAQKNIFLNFTKWCLNFTNQTRPNISHRNSKQRSNNQRIVKKIKPSSWIKFLFSWRHLNKKQGNLATKIKI